MKNFRKILNEIEKGQIAPVYFLSGDERYFANKIEDKLLKKVVSPEAKSFDEQILYAPENDLMQTLLRARAFPMLAAKQLIAIREAQSFFKKANDSQLIKEYVDNPALHTVLIFKFSGKPAAKIKNIFDKNPHSVYYESPRLYESRMGELIGEIFGSFGFTLQPKSELMLLEAMGTDLMRYEKEAEKLSVVFPDGKQLTPEIIEEYVGISKDFNIFEMKAAIASGNKEKAYKIAGFFAQNPKEYSIHALIAVLYDFFVKLYKFNTLPNRSDNRLIASELKINPYFVGEFKRASSVFPMKKISKNIEILRQTDLFLKGFGPSQTPYRDTINELIYKLINPV